MAKHKKSCNCVVCNRRKKKQDKAKGINNTWARFSSDPSAYYRQIKKEDQRYNDLCWEVTVKRVNLETGEIEEYNG